MYRSTSASFGAAATAAGPSHSRSTVRVLCGGMAGIAALPSVLQIASDVIQSVVGGALGGQVRVRPRPPLRRHVDLLSPPGRRGDRCPPVHRNSHAPAVVVRLE